MTPMTPIHQFTGRGLTTIIGARRGLWRFLMRESHE
jgi:hypothetical protein